MRAARQDDVRRLRFACEDPDQLDALDVLEKLFLLLLVARDGFIRCGDFVHHAPSGETWAVAYADYARGDLAWAGWPEGSAAIVHCTLTKACTDEEHAAEVAAWLDHPSTPAPGQSFDHRRAAIRRLYRSARAGSAWGAETPAPQEQNPAPAPGETAGDRTGAARVASYIAAMAQVIAGYAPGWPSRDRAADEAFVDRIAQGLTLTVRQTHLAVSNVLLRRVADMPDGAVRAELVRTASAVLDIAPSPHPGPGAEETSGAGCLPDAPTSEGPEPNHVPARGPEETGAVPVRLTDAELAGLRDVVRSFPRSGVHNFFGPILPGQSSLFFGDPLLPEVANIIHSLVDEVIDARRLLGAPELHDFARAVVLEAAHQRARWPSEHDAGKAPSDWFWLLGYLSGKALQAAATGYRDGALHHTISSAAALANWHAALLGKTDMRPGIETPPGEKGDPARG